MVARRRARAATRLGAAALLALALLAGCDDETPPAEVHFCPACPNGQSYRCPAPARLCAGAGCVDVSADPAHCGGCGLVCPAGAQCVAGACRGGPAPGCDPGCRDGETCVDGACQLRCPPPLALCAHGEAPVCTDLATDPGNCGTCGLACPGGCADGFCR